MNRLAKQYAETYSTTELLGLLMQQLHQLKLVRIRIVFLGIAAFIVYQFLLYTYGRYLLDATQEEWIRYNIAQKLILSNIIGIMMSVAVIASVAIFSSIIVVIAKEIIHYIRVK